ncbi:Extracellular protein SEL-1, partial [Pseudoloma neurophilia]
HSPFYEHILCHNSFFSFISTDNIDIYKTYLKITGKIVTKYLNNRFFFHDKIDYSNIKKYPKPEYLMQLIRAGDKKAEEIFIQMLVTGSLSPVNHIKDLIYLSEERKNGKAMTLLGNLYLSNLISNDNSNKDYSIDNSIDKSNKDDSIDKSNKDDSGKHQQKNENTNNNTTSNNTTSNKENKEKTTVDTTTAMHYFRSAVAMGDFFAYNGLGRLFMMDNHLEQSLARGYFEEAAYRGSAEGDYNLYLYFKKVYGIEDSHRLIRAVKKSYMPALYTYAQRLYKQGEINQAIAHLLPISEYDYPIVALQDQAYIDLKNGKLIECFYKLLFLTETGSINAINNLIYLLTSEKVKNVPCNFFGVSDNTGENNKTEK